MYQQQGLQEAFYLILYGAVTMLAVLACLYLLLRRRNMLGGTEPPVALRRWTAAFLAADALSHVWWFSLGSIVLQEDRFVRNAVNIGLDSVTLVPLMMAVLLRMLQDCRRRLWPVAVTAVPVVVAVAVGIARRDGAYEDFLRYYLLTLVTAFAVYLTYAVRQYGRWLNENYADMENKEVWQSMVLLLVILLMFVCYKTNFGGMLVEYAVQVNTLVLIAFLVWRVETLKKLTPDPSLGKGTVGGATLPDIGSRLKLKCEDTELYLRNDMKISELATILGTNRTYLSTWFAQQGLTYSTYINRLRIEYFCRHYDEVISNITLQALAVRCGYGSYSSFNANFKKIKGMTVTAWAEERAQEQAKEHSEEQSQA